MHTYCTEVDVLVLILHYSYITCTQSREQGRVPESCIIPATSYELKLFQNEKFLKTIHVAHTHTLLLLDSTSVLREI